VAASKGDRSEEGRRHHAALHDERDRPLERWFESPIFIGLQAVNGIIGTWAGPDAPGTAYVLMHHSVGDIGDGEIASWGYPEGGMGAVGDACRRAAEAFGTEVRVSSPVERVLVTEGRAKGVVLNGGEEIHAPLVVTAIHPRITFLRQIDRSELPPEFSPTSRTGRRARAR
jgi:phytoene dehydrogenase-like protein